MSTLNAVVAPNIPYDTYKKLLKEINSNKENRTNSNKRDQNNDNSSSYHGKRNQDHTMDYDMNNKFPSSSQLPYFRGSYNQSPFASQSLSCLPPPSSQFYDIPSSPFYAKQPHSDSSSVSTSSDTLLPQSPFYRQENNSIHSDHTYGFSNNNPASRPSMYNPEYYDQQSSAPLLERQPANNELSSLPSYDPMNRLSISSKSSGNSIHKIFKNAASSMSMTIIL